MGNIAESLYFVENEEMGNTCRAGEVNVTSRKEANKMAEVDMNILEIYYSGIIIF